MSGAWWGKEASVSDRGQSVTEGAPPAIEPTLTPATRAAVIKELNDRIDGYTRDWTNRRASDAGVALVKLFGEEMEPVLQRTNRLPEKAFVEFLRSGGIQPMPPTPAKALLQFTASDAAVQPLYIPQGFQVTAPAANGGEPVIFETSADLYALPGKIQELYAFERGFYRPIDISKDNIPFQPFGDRPRPGLSFFIGISAVDGVDFGSQLSLGIELRGTADAPPPVSAGGVVPLPTPLGPFLKWDALDGSTYRELRVVRDDTKGLLQSGVIVLALPETWAPGIPAGAADSVPLRWVRLEIAYGTFLSPPTILFVKLNMVSSTAVRTIRDEILNPVTGTGGSVWSLSQSPVLPGSLSLKVDDSADFSAMAISSTADASRSSQWKEVDDLTPFGPDDQVFVLDSVSGQVKFGNNKQGKAVPAGFRNIRATSYQVGGGASGAVAAKKISGPVNSIPFLADVTNPSAATGGMDEESQDTAKRRGPKELRAHGRAVAAADYEILALRLPGALVARAKAVSGFHPAFPGKFIPGVVCVFVIPPRRGVGPPTADQNTLASVASALSKDKAPDGVEIVAAAPIFHSVRVVMSAVIDPVRSRSDAVRDILQLLDVYLDPVVGGDDQQGWPFGGALSYITFVRKILAEVKGVTAIPRLQFVVDGVRGATCSDFPISPNTLVWGSGHEILALGPGENS